MIMSANGGNAVGIQSAFPLAGIRAAGGFGGVGMETRYEVTARNKAGKTLWVAHAKNRVVTVGLNKVLDATFKTGLASPAWYVGLCGASITNGAISSGTAALSSVSNPFVAADAGRAIIVRGAGTAGADLVTTIATYVSAGNVTLADNASTTVAGASVIWEARAGDTMSSHSPWTDNVNYSNANRPAFTPGVIASGSVDNSSSQATFSINVNNTLIGGLFLIDNNTVSGTAGTLYGMAPFSTVGFRQVNNGDTLSVTATLTAAST
jgi:hypothetical protein